MLTCFNCSSNVSKVRGPCEINDSRCVLEREKRAVNTFGWGLILKWYFCTRSINKISSAHSAARPVPQPSLRREWERATSDYPRKRQSFHFISLCNKRLRKTSLFRILTARKLEWCGERGNPIVPCFVDVFGSCFTFSPDWQIRAEMCYLDKEKWD